MTSDVAMPSKKKSTRPAKRPTLGVVLASGNIKAFAAIPLFEFLGSNRRIQLERDTAGLACRFRFSAWRFLSASAHAHPDASGPPANHGPCPWATAMRDPASRTARRRRS